MGLFSFTQEIAMDLGTANTIITTNGKIVVDEPSVEDSISILRGIKDKYELHHGVRIKDDAVISSVELSSRYIADRFLPDKAIDLMDEAAAKLDGLFQPGQQLLFEAEQGVAVEAIQPLAGDLGGHFHHGARRH